MRRRKGVPITHHLTPAPHPPSKPSFAHCKVTRVGGCISTPATLLSQLPPARNQKQLGASGALPGPSSLPTPQHTMLKVKAGRAWGWGKCGGGRPGPFVRRRGRSPSVSSPRPGRRGRGVRALQPGSEGGSGRAPVTPSPLSPPGEGGGEHWDLGVRDPDGVGAGDEKWRKRERAKERDGENQVARRRERRQGARREPRRLDSQALGPVGS